MDLFLSESGSILGCLKLSWAVFGAIWGYLRQSWAILGAFWDRFWAILNNFETILGTSSTLAPKTFGQSDFFCYFWITSQTKRLQIWHLLVIFGVTFLDHFLVTFWTTFGDHFGAHFRTRSAKEGARWAQEGHQELQRPTKLHFQKSGFRVRLSAFFRSWGLPREPQEAQEGSQEAPKELLNPKKKGSKIDPKIDKFWTNFGVQNEFQNLDQN